MSPKFVKRLGLTGWATIWLTVVGFLFAAPAIGQFQPYYCNTVGCFFPAINTNTLNSNVVNANTVNSGVFNGNTLNANNVLIPNATVTSGGVVPTNPNTSLIFLGDDMLGTLPISTSNAGTGGGFYGISTPGGVPTVPTGWTAASLGAHPGLISVNTSALNDRGQAWLASGSSNHMVFSGGPTITWRLLFSTPNVLSTAGDRYIFRVGTVQNSSGTLAGQGFYLRYSDDVNTGKWQLCDILSASGGEEVIASSSVAPVAGTWNVLSITKSGTSTITATLNGVQIATGSSAYLSGGTIMEAPLAGMQMIRTTFTSGTITAFMDRADITIGPITR